MHIEQIFILGVIAVFIGQLKKNRSLALLGVSVFIIYWLQPPQIPASLTYWLPTGTLAITVLAWLLTSIPEVRGWGKNLPAIAVLVGVMILLDLNRYLQIEQIYIIETPRLQWVGAAIVVIGAALWTLASLGIITSLSSLLFAISVIGILILIKTPDGSAMISNVLLAISRKQTTGTISLSWLGFSYVSFRLIHTILDCRAGRLQSVPLAEYVNYVIFFPSFTAGPIDRLERFVRDLNEPVKLDHEGWMDAGTRFFSGLFKKFVVADSLAWIALNDAFLSQVNSSGWMWILLYAFSLRLYFDFSGYTDMAVGLGRWMGIRLPENFDRPYLKPNLTQFWNAWHMTLTQWFRSYYFNPVTRALRSAERPLSQPIIILLAQVSTMILIGLWHGITIGYILWGLWHGFGLFVHNRWNDFIRARGNFQETSPFRQQALKYTGVFLTFHFVSLGWLFFALPSPESAWSAVLKLFGIV